MYFVIFICIDLNKPYSETSQVQSPNTSETIYRHTQSRVVRTSVCVCVLAYIYGSPTTLTECKTTNIHSLTNLFTFISPAAIDSLPPSLCIHLSPSIHVHSGKRHVICLRKMKVLQVHILCDMHI